MANNDGGQPSGSANNGRLHFGSLASVKQQQDAARGDEDVDMTPGQIQIAKGIAAGNINILGKNDETFELSGASLAAQEKHAETLRSVEASRRARSIAVPTVDLEVKVLLRKLGEVAMYFGESEYDRRDRCRHSLANRDIDNAEAEVIDGLLAAARNNVRAGVGMEDEESSSDEEQELFYTPAPDGLKACRRLIAAFSWERTQQRLEDVRQRRVVALRGAEADAKALDVVNTLRSMRANASQVGDSRPLATCAFSPGGDLVGTGSWSSMVKLWDTETAEEYRSLRGHTERITGMAFHPSSGCKGTAPSDCPAPSRDGANVVTGSADCTAKVWSLESSAALLTLSGHVDRLARVAWHPCGRYVGTASFDKTWRLWDLEADGAELLLQEGHAHEVYAIAFQRDGSLVATGDLGGVCRVWDTRSGKSIMLQQGHVRHVLGVDFSPNGYHCATCSNDNTCRIWDLRKKGTLYTIPAHSNLISDVKYEQTHGGEFLATSSYDGFIKIWSGRDFSALAELGGHEGKVMGIGIAPDSKHLLSVGFDRTFKLWAHESEF